MTSGVSETRTTGPLFIVTGGSRGIGEAIARSAAQAGFQVLLTYAGRAADAQAVVDAIRSGGGVAEAIQADTGRPDDIARLFARADALGRLAAIAYSGGITGGEGLLADQDDATLARVIEINLTGALLCAREAVKRMSTRLDGKGGSIIFLGSRASTLGAPAQHVWYAASKGGVDSLTIGLSKEVAAEGIRVNCVVPGPVNTEIHAPGRLDRIREALPMRRAGEPQEVADAVMYLVSEKASYISGTLLQVSGAR